MATLHGPLDEEGAWIVCRGRVVVVHDGLVACDGTTHVPIERCLGCRYLETLSGERELDASCATPDPVTRPASTLRR